MWVFLFFGWGGWGQGLRRVVTDHSHSVVGSCILCGQLQSCSVFVNGLVSFFQFSFFKFLVEVENLQREGVNVVRSLRGRMGREVGVGTL